MLRILFPPFVVLISYHNGGFLQMSDYSSQYTVKVKKRKKADWKLIGEIAYQLAASQVASWHSPQGFLNVGLLSSPVGPVSPEDPLLPAGIVEWRVRNLPVLKRGRVGWREDFSLHVQSMHALHSSVLALQSGISDLNSWHCTHLSPSYLLLLGSGGK